MNNTSHAVRATQPLTSGNEGDVWDMHFCIDLVLSHSMWPMCCLTLLMLTVLLVLECLNLLICLQLFLQHHLICIAAHGWFFPCYYCYSHGLGKAVVEFNEDNCPVLTRQAAILERAELVLERVLECTWAFSAMITPRKYKKKTIRSQGMLPWECSSVRGICAHSNKCSVSHKTQQVPTYQNDLAASVQAGTDFNGVFQLISCMQIQSV